MEKKAFVTREQVEKMVRDYPTPFHLYDEKEDKEIAVLEPVEMKARLGAKHIVQVTGSKEEGYTAGLAALRPLVER